MIATNFRICISGELLSIVGLSIFLINDLRIDLMTKVE